MMMSRTAASIVMTLACALALRAVAQPVTAGAPPKGAARIYSLEVDGKSGVLKGAQIQAGSAATGVPMDFKLPASALSDLTLTMGTGLPQRFYDWVSAAFVGKQMAFAATLHAVETTGRAGETIAIANPRLVGVAFGALDQASHAPMHMDVKLRAAVKPEAAKSPTLPKAGSAASTRWLVSGYRLTLGKLDTGHVT